MKGEESNDLLKKIVFLIIIVVVLLIFVVAISGEGTTLAKAIKANLGLMLPMFS